MLSILSIHLERLFSESPINLLQNDHFAFIGVIATLVVLSILPSLRKDRNDRNEHNESLSNLLIDLIKSFKFSIDLVYSEKIRKLNEEIKEVNDKLIEEYDKYIGASRKTYQNGNENIESEFDNSTYEREKIKTDFAYLMLKIEAVHKTEREKSKESTYIEDNTPAFMSFFTFILSVAVMTIHCIPFHKDFNASILFLFDILFLIVSLSSWAYYFLDWIKKSETEIKEKNDKWQQIAYLFVLIVLIICFLALKDVRIVMLMIFIAVASMCNYTFIKNMNQKKHYDHGTVALMALIGMFFSLIPSLYLGCFEWSNRMNWAQNRLVVIENVGFITNHVQWWSIGFVILCVFNAFAFPIFISFIRYEVARNQRFKRNKVEWRDEISRIREQIANYANNGKRDDNTIMRRKESSEKKRMRRKRKRRERRKKRIYRKK